MIERKKSGWFTLLVFASGTSGIAIEVVMNWVVCQGLPRSIDAVQSVQRIDLEVAEKEFVLLLGPSGCGKVTTLRMIVVLEEISDGCCILVAL